MRESILDLRGVGRMHYLDEGQPDAPPVLMLHREPDMVLLLPGGEKWWWWLVLALRSTHRVIVPDHIGMGLSDKPDESSKHQYTLAPARGGCWRR